MLQILKLLLGFCDFPGGFGLCDLQLFHYTGFIKGICNSSIVGIVLLQRFKEICNLDIIFFLPDNNCYVEMTAVIIIISIGHTQI